MCGARGMRRTKYTPVHLCLCDIWLCHAATSSTVAPLLVPPFPLWPFFAFPFRAPPANEARTPRCSVPSTIVVVAVLSGAGCCCWLLMRCWLACLLSFARLFLAQAHGWVCLFVDSARCLHASAGCWFLCSGSRECTLFSFILPGLSSSC